MRTFAQAAALFFSAAVLTPADAAQLSVSTPEELSSALADAQPGDDIILETGVYEGGLFREGLTDVTIRSANKNKPAVIRGGGFGMMLSDPVDVTLSDLVFEKQLANGLNIDDAGSFETPARNVRLIRVTVRDIVERGNNDAIKMAGVVGFVIDGVKVKNWGDDGSAIDFVGCRDGLVQNALLIHKRLSIGGSGIRPKGGSKNIVIRANRLEIPAESGRGIQAGGSTDAEFFRFEEGDSGYEASEITVEGNVVVGGGAAFTWVNIDGGVFHHNYAERQAPWILRILNENPGSDIVDTRNGVFEDNEISFATGGAFNTHVNIGDETEPGTFRFARNRWLNTEDPGDSEPDLPTEEEGGVYGEPLTNASNRPQVWTFPWGLWVVNATTSRKTVDIDGFAELRRAKGGKTATFSPLEAQPLSGNWKTKPLGSGSISLKAMSQVILVNAGACPDCR